MTESERCQSVACVACRSEMRGEFESKAIATDFARMLGWIRVGNVLLCSTCREKSERVIGDLPLRTAAADARNVQSPSDELPKVRS